MFNSIFSIIAIPLGWLMRGCYWLSETVLHLPLSYMFALLLFALITKLMMFPLSYKQHISTARMQAFNPLIKDIQTRYRNSPEKMNRELEKLYGEFGYSPTQGCLPMLLNLLIMFGLVEVIYRPLSFMLMLPKDLITALTTRTIELEAALGNTIAANNRYIETFIIRHVKSDFSAFADLAAASGEELAQIQNLQMSISSVNLYDMPKMALSFALLIPIFSVVTQLLSVWVTAKTSTGLDGNAARQQRTMMLTTVAMGAVFTFMYPLGFALYWGFQNLLGMAQSLLLKKLRDPEVVKEELLAEIKRKQKEKKARRKVSYVDNETGETVEKEMSANELARLRLQRAREIDRERYGE